ncbi:MAG: hypothetical protein H7319_17575 [Spirosoma sp.]|nr:hypothetical protein [Spirosoma sp.]
MKRLLYLFALVAFVATLNACSKTTEPAPVSPVVGRWILNRGLLSGFTTAPNLNGRSIDLLYFENYAATIDLFADKTFNSNDKSVTVDDSPGTWDYTDPNLTLKYDSGTQETYTYAKNKNIEELTLTPAVSYTLPVSTTATAVGKLNFVYRK